VADEPTASSPNAPEEIDALAEEFLTLRRAGQPLTLEEFAARHPHSAGEIRELFPLILAMEDAKDARNAETSGRVKLGPRMEQLGEFKILREIGRGGMGVVFEAHQPSLDRKVALKVLPQTVLNPQALARFQREARLAASIQHPNIVGVHSIGEENGIHFFAMQMVHGVSWDVLIEHLAKNPGDQLTPLDAVVRKLLNSDENNPAPRIAQGGYYRQVARMARDAARGLHYAHERGLLHRDIKPANLLLDTLGQVFLTDFGLARALQPEGTAISCDSVGTVRYMAPEQLHNRADARSDIHGLGVALYEMLSLQRAFGDSPRETLLAQIQNRQRAALMLPAAVPSALQKIVARATALNPDDRYPSAAFFAKELDRFLLQEPPAQKRIAPISPLAAVLLGCGLGLLAVFSAYALSSFWTRPPEPQPAGTDPHRPLFAPKKPPEKNF
jgi:eukaryotic-like serine/threonine-protein kinase